MGRHTGCNRGNTKIDSKEDIMAALVEQRKKYKKAFDKVSLHLRKVEELAYQKALARRLKQKKNKHAHRGTNKTDLYDKL
jgi:hypothetical protein